MKRYEKRIMDVYKKGKKAYRRQWVAGAIIINIMGISIGREAWEREFYKTLIISLIMLFVSILITFLFFPLIWERLEKSYELIKRKYKELEND